MERILYFHLDSTTFANLRQIFSKHIEQYIYSTLETKKHHPQKRVMLQILRNIYIASCTTIGYIRQPGMAISCKDLVIANGHAFIIVG